MKRTQLKSPGRNSGDKITNFYAITILFSAMGKLLVLIHYPTPMQFKQMSMSVWPPSISPCKTERPSSPQLYKRKCRSIQSDPLPVSPPPPPLSPQTQQQYPRPFLSISPTCRKEMQDRTRNV